MGIELNNSIFKYFFMRNFRSSLLKKIGVDGLWNLKNC
jgi:hypothetical protein